jgi:hypothetical protein
MLETKTHTHTHFSLGYMLDPASEIQATLLRNHTRYFAIALLNASMSAESSHTADMVPEDLLHRPGDSKEAL